MTKVQITLKLSREMDDPELASLSHLHSVYGIFAVRVLPANALLIEYDAARLSPSEVRGTVEEHGIPIE